MSSLVIVIYFDYFSLITNLWLCILVVVHPTLTLALLMELLIRTSCFLFPNNFTLIECL